MPAYTLTEEQRAIVARALLAHFDSICDAARGAFRLGSVGAQATLREQAAKVNELLAVFTVEGGG